jgi:hypothetical protein
MEDLLGRSLVTFHKRDALVTASATLTTGTNTTLIAGDSDYPLDLVEVTFSNQSTVAAQVTLQDDGTTIKTLEIPQGTTQLVPPTGYPQGRKGGNWTVDMEDITGTTVVVEALFVRNS